MVACGLGSQDRHEGSSQLSVASVSLPLGRASTLVPTMNPQIPLGPSFLDQPPMLENFTLASLSVWEP